MHDVLVAVLVVALGALRARAYIPAVPTNNTNAVNRTDMSMLTMKWAPAGTYSNTISFQLAKANSTGFEQGALVHFSEKGLTNENTTTPWIAFVNCDANTTDASEEDDIFTLARDRGAVGALLYSSTSEACLINPEYASPDNFEQILDIFATQSKPSAQIINSQFSNLHNTSFGNFDAHQLNNSADAIAASMRTNNVTSPFIVANLKAANSTVSPNSTSDSGDGSPDSPPTPRSNPNTGLAMIILYAITGCVSGLFIIVILSGAIRAIRHPERYGPRAGDPNGIGPGAPAQSRTGGIGRAILDTFPIIKFGQGGAGAETVASEPKGPDVENQVSTTSGSIEMTTPNMGVEKVTGGTASASHAATESSSSPAAHVTESSSSTKTSNTNAGSAPGAEAGTPREDVKPGAIGHETCPICIVDFEAGDDLRVLPCEGKHKFHQACVDPWLLELSSSCPLCREDFHALESMMAGNETSDAEGSTSPPPDTPVPSAVGAHSSRFSKYLRFARRRNRAPHAETNHAGSEQPDTSSREES